MSHTDIIWIVGTLTFASTVGVYAAIRYIKLHTRPPVNTLVRSGDLELIDYIEPTQPHHNYPDLLVPEFPRESSTPPSYHTIDRLNINSVFENAINLDFILFLILFCVFLLLIRKLIISNKLKNKIINHIVIISLLLFSAIIYIQFGLLVLSQIIILFIIMILYNSLLGLNPYNKLLHIIKIMSIILIIFILYYNSSTP